MARPKKEVEETKSETPSNVIAEILKENSEYHYNDVEEVKTEKISTGSLILDSQMDGGFDSGLVRFVGFTEGGKTSESFEVTNNFFKTVPKSRALYIKSEGRLSAQMQARSGLKFVWKPEEWVDGTVFVLETNSYILVIKMLRKLIKTNVDGRRYVFIFDSMDALMLDSDMEKEIHEAGKVAGAPMLTKKFMTQFSNAMNKLGHLCIMIGQVSAKVEIDPYAPKDNRQISATGGNAALHFSNWILQFEARFKGDLILEDDKAAPDPIKNKLLGHWCKIVIKKSPNEKSNMVVKYPIKYGRTGGNSIWREYEIVDVMLMFNLLEKKGAWLTISDSIVSEAKQDSLEIDEQHQGIDNFRVYLEENVPITDWLFAKLKKVITG